MTALSNPYSRTAGATRLLPALRRTALTLALAGASTAGAAGFAVDTQAARATGLGTAISGVVDDPSSLYYNPSGLVRAKGLQVQLGVSLLLPSINIEPADGGATQSTEASVSPPPHLYASYRVHDRVAFGIGLSTPFGANSKWPEGWRGAELTRSASLAVYDMSAAGAVQLHERLRMGGSLRLLRGTVHIERELNFIDSRGSVELGGSGWGFAWSVGGQLDIIPSMLVLGVNYRSGSSMDFDGRAHFDSPPSFESLMRDQPISSNVDIPSFLLMGLAWTPLEQLTVAFDAHYVGWSSFRELRFEFEDPALTSTTRKDWGDAWSYHLGGEYRMDALSLRLGLVYDTTPSPDGTLTPDLPDSDRFKVAAGVGYQLGMFTGDLGYQYVALIGKRSTAPAFPGHYGGHAHVVGITLGAKL